MPAAAPRKDHCHNITPINHSYYWRRRVDSVEKTSPEVALPLEGEPNSTLTVHSEHTHLPLAFSLFSSFFQSLPGHGTNVLVVEVEWRTAVESSSSHAHTSTLFPLADSSSIKQRALEGMDSWIEFIASFSFRSWCSTLSLSLTRHLCLID